ncbi:oocyte zinc finger protein XlCOF29-like [Dendrobates tinctorius]|uniref:oocyte zinc finger protein XlCOF29-like n=1 Tax=Dendrobates tinctorius TaxID=92724 RepID=UPI003CC9506E
MDMDRDKMAERMLHLTLEILFRLTGEDYTVVKKTSSDRCQDPVSEGWGRPLSPITGPPPHPLIHEDINDQKILELTYKMMELLTGELQRVDRSSQRFKSIMVFTDLSAVILNRRRVFSTATKILRDNRITYKWGYPVIVTKNGVTQVLTSP